MSRKTSDERFWEKVNKQGPDECWLWLASKNRGYGSFDGCPAHKWLFERLYGKVADGLTLDHLCRTRACVNPSHLEAVSVRVNVLRGVGPSARNAAKTHCPKGHRLYGGNLYVSNGRRHCRACRDASERQRRWTGRLPSYARTHCPQGHAYAGDNIEWTTDGRRVCVACKRARWRQWYAETRSKGKGLPADRTHCPSGHEYAGENVYRDKTGRRHCRTCKLEKQRERRKRASKVVP